MDAPVGSALHGLRAAGARRLRIAFVVTGLRVGGAEMMLWKLLSRLDRSRFEPSLIALSGEEIAMLPAFQQLGIPCEHLGWKPGRASIRDVTELTRALRASAPDIVQGWMYHANIAATMAAASARLKVPVLWNIRASLMSREHEKRLTRLLIWLGGKLSFSPAAIINNSTTSAIEHETRMGYRRSKRVIVPNGFDTDRFAPSPEARDSLRASLGLAPDAFLIGLVARYHAMKGHDVFLRAAQVLCREHDVHFVLAGEDVEPANAELATAVERSAAAGRVHLLGPRKDVDRITAALDVMVSSSTSGEGFPNVIGEAMSCAVPCVVTDVGDSAAVVADTGVTVPPGDPDAIAAGVARIMALDSAARAALGVRARQRVLEHYSLDAIVQQYETLYSRIHRERSN